MEDPRIVTVPPRSDAKDKGRRKGAGERWDCSGYGCGCGLRGSRWVVRGPVRRCRDVTRCYHGLQYSDLAPLPYSPIRHHIWAEHLALPRGTT